MRKFPAKIIIVFFVMVFTLAIGMPSLRAESGLADNNWWQSLNRMQSNEASPLFSLEHEELRLPDGDFQMFSEEGQEKLYDVASRFGDTNDEDIDREDLFQNFQIDSTSQLDDNYRNSQELNVEGLDTKNYQLGSRLTLEADDNREVEGDGTDPAPNFNLTYQFSDSTTLRAGLGRSYVHSLDIDVGEDGETAERDQIEEDEDAPEEGLEEPDNENEGDESRNDDESTMEPLEPGEVSWAEEESEFGTLGISYQPADSLAFTADYSQGNIFENPNEEGTISAALGLEYYDRLGNIRASYQIDDGDQMQQMTTGLQMEVMDFAQFSASYSLLDFEEIEDKLRQQTSLDLGLDLNINEFSTFSLGYQLQENFSALDEEGEDESNIRASFTIDF